MSDPPTLVEIMEAIASQLESEIDVDGLQVDPLAVPNPTPPCIDLYPGDPFMEAISFDDGEERTFTIRARVSTADNEAGQALLLSLMDRGAGSILAACRSDRTFGGAVDDSVVEGPGRFQAYPDASGSNAGSLLGCEWQLRVER